MDLSDYCGKCLHWIWGKSCKCGRFQNGKNVEKENEN